MANVNITAPIATATAGPPVYDVIPHMTSNTEPSGEITDVYGTSIDPWKAVDGNTNTFCDCNAEGEIYLRYWFYENGVCTTSKKITHFSVRVKDTGVYGVELYAYNGTSWFSFNAHSGVSLNADEAKIFEFSDPNGI